MAEFVIIKGRGGNEIELYRCGNKRDTLERFVEYGKLHGQPDRYMETLVTKTMVYDWNPEMPTYYEYREE